PFEGFAQPIVGVGVLRKEDEARRLAIEAGDGAGCARLASAAEVVSDSVGERTSEDGPRRVDEDACGFVDDEDVPVLVGYGEGERLRDDGAFDACGQAELDAIPGRRPPA